MLTMLVLAGIAMLLLGILLRADFVYNIALGRSVEFARRVENNDPANAALQVIIIDAGAVSDATLKDVDTLAALEATGANEVGNSGYARKDLLNGSLTITVDDSNDRTDLDFADQTWTAVAAGAAWTDLVVCYVYSEPTGTSSDFIPMTQHDFAVTPDGSDITAQLNASGFFRVS